MKLLISVFILNLTYLTPNAYTQTLGVLSDLDDTLKVAHTTKLPAIIHRSLFSKEAFPEMSTLFRGMEENQDTEFALLSGTPVPLLPKIQSFLMYHFYPRFVSITLKGNLLEKTVDYKKREATRVIQKWWKNGVREFVLIGDDTQGDPEAYEWIQKNYPDAEIRVYIRNITGRKIPKNQTKFFTGLEISILEAQSDRISSYRTQQIAFQLSQLKTNSFFPFFASCPTPDWFDEILSKDFSLQELEKEVRSKVKQECEIRDEPKKLHYTPRS